MTALVAGALRQAGFPGVEAEGEVIHARLSASGTEFRAEPEGAGWRLSLTWPMRAGAAQIAGWNAAHPGAAMDIHRGETRVSLRSETGVPDLILWAALAEEAVATLVRWRRDQRAPGEGM